MRLMVRRQIVKIYFLGILFCEEALKHAYRDSFHGVSMAPHVFQTNLLSGFENIEEVDVEVINIPPTGSFPINNRKIYSKGYRWGKENRQIGYINLPRIKWQIQKRKIVKELDRKLRDIEDYSEITIMAYSVYEPFLDVMNSIKLKYPGIQLCLIQTDPIMGRGERDKYMTPKAVAEGNRIVEKAKIVDKFILLTKYLADTIEVGKRQYCVIECVCNDKQPQSREGLHRNICLYTGTLNEEFGIKDLVDAFTMIENAELWICGDGNTKDYILQQSSVHKNIKYFGYLTRDEIQKKQDECDFLINPRRPSGTYTMYSFPSKTAEYLMTGKPVIMYKLEGIPDEYDVYIEYLTGNLPSDVAFELNNIFRKPYNELKERAYYARLFMQKEKAGIIQAKKIRSFLEKKYND